VPEPEHLQPLGGFIAAIDDVVAAVQQRADFLPATQPDAQPRLLAQGFRAGDETNKRSVPLHPTAAGRYSGGTPPHFQRQSGQFPTSCSTGLSQWTRQTHRCAFKYSSR